MSDRPHFAAPVVPAVRDEANGVEYLDFYERDTDRVGHEDKEHEVDEQMYRHYETPAQQERVQINQHETQSRDKHVMMSDDDECVDDYPAWLRRARPWDPFDEPTQKEESLDQ